MHTLLGYQIMSNAQFFYSVEDSKGSTNKRDHTSCTLILTIRMGQILLEEQTN